MSRNWLRKCSLSVGDATIEGGGQTDLRIVFSIKQWHFQAPNMGRFRVYNASPSTVSKLRASEGAKVELSAGYEGNVGVVFTGEVKQTRSGHETAVDSFVDVFAADGDQGYNQARVTKTLAAGYTPKDRLQVALDAMAQFGVTLGVNALDLSQPKYPRGLPMIGMARDVIRSVVLSKGGIWSTQLGKVMITPKSLEGASSGTITLSGRTGLIGWPEQTQDGILVRSLLNPALQPLMKVKIDPSLILAGEQDNNPLSQSGPATNQNLDQQALGAGTYTIFHMDRFGDTRGQDWIDESLCIGEGGSLPASQAQQGYSLGDV